MPRQQLRPFLFVSLCCSHFYDYPRCGAIFFLSPFEFPFGFSGFFFTFCELLNKSTLRCATVVSELKGESWPVCNSQKRRSWHVCSSQRVKKKDYHTPLWLGTKTPTRSVITHITACTFLSLTYVVSKRHTRDTISWCILKNTHCVSVQVHIFGQALSNTRYTPRSALWKTHRVCQYKYTFRDKRTCRKQDWSLP